MVELMNHMFKLPQNNWKRKLNMYNKCIELNGKLVKVNKIWILKILEHC